MRGDLKNGDQLTLDCSTETKKDVASEAKDTKTKTAEDKPEKKQPEQQQKVTIVVRTQTGKEFRVTDSGSGGIDSL